MFGYTEEDLMKLYRKYPQKNEALVKGIMRFIIASAFPLLTEDERVQMDHLKLQYEELLCKLSHDAENMDMIIRSCLQTLTQAVQLYDQSFDRLANYYFDEVYN